jgi:dihydrofolate reductase
MIISLWARDYYTNVIAVDGKLPWHIPSDLKRFKCFTNNSTVLIGRKTYETLPNKNLPNRKLLIFSSDLQYPVTDKENHQVINDYSFLDRFKNNYNENLFIAGGNSIYLNFILNKDYRPDYIIDCELKNKEISDRINSFSKERKLVLSPKIDNIIKDNYLPLKSFKTKDNFTNTVFLKKDQIIDFLFETSNKNF